jgi:hypothetical protein
MACKNEPVNRNVADPHAFAAVMAALEGKVQLPNLLRIKTSKEGTQAALDLHTFEYTAFVQAEISVGTNAVFGGGDSGHGWETEIRLYLEGGDVRVDFLRSGDDPEEEAGGLLEFPGTLVIRAGGCDEAQALATLFELAAVALRQQLVKNSKAMIAGDAGIA